MPSSRGGPEGRAVDLNVGAVYPAPVYPGVREGAAVSRFEECAVASSGLVPRIH